MKSMTTKSNVYKKLERSLPRALPYINGGENCTALYRRQSQQRASFMRREVNLNKTKLLTSEANRSQARSVAKTGTRITQHNETLGSKSELTSLCTYNSKTSGKLASLKEESKKRKCCCHKEEEAKKYPYLKKKTYDFSHNNTLIKLSVETNSLPAIDAKVPLAPAKMEEPKRISPVLPAIEVVRQRTPEEKKRLSSEERLEVWSKLVTKIEEQMRQKRVRFHVRVWKFYKKAWRRKLKVLCGRRLQQLKARAAIRIYKRWTIYKNVRHYKSIKRKICKIQAHWKGCKVRKHYLHCKKMAIRIQAQAKKYLSTKRFNLFKALVIRLQAMARLFLHRHHKKINKLARKIQHFMRTIKDRKLLQELRKNRIEEERRAKVKREALAKLELNRARKAAVFVIEEWWYKILCKRGLRKVRECLKRLPYDCRILWIKLNCAKAQTFYLKQEIEDLVNKKGAKD